MNTKDEIAAQLNEAICSLQRVLVKVDRIAPEPRKAREWVLHPNIGVDGYSVCERPECFQHSKETSIRVREVLPDDKT